MYSDRVSAFTLHSSGVLELRNASVYDVLKKKPNLKAWFID